MLCLLSPRLFCVKAVGAEDVDCYFRIKSSSDSDIFLQDRQLGAA